MSQPPPQDENQPVRSAADPPETPSDETEGARPEDLPPVEPPSAGFIVQLFVIPALIVIAVIGVWALFGKLASANQNWQALVQDLQSANKHRRGPAAASLANLLLQDQRREENGQQLAANPQLARSIAALFREKLKTPRTNEETSLQLQYLRSSFPRCAGPSTPTNRCRSAATRCRRLLVSLIVLRSRGSRLPLRRWWNR